jgi:hypothetical protein
VKVSRRRGVIRLALDPVEVQVLGQLLDELDELIEVMAPDDEPTRRLFPSGHRDDEDAAAQFRELTEQGLRDTRKVRYGLIRAALPVGGGVIELSGEDQTPWLTTLNDLRLALGTRIGVTEDETPFASGDSDDPDDPDAQGWALYYWLTALQDCLVKAAMRGSGR